MTKQPILLNKGLMLKWLATTVTLASTSLLVGCDIQPSESHANPPASNMTVNKTGLDIQPNAVNANEGGVTLAEATAPRAKSNAQAIADSLEVSYARAAAQQANLCPKLLDFQFKTQSITRENEQLNKTSCEYFVYLKEKDTLRVKVTGDIEVQLVSPVWFNFANGDYIAPKFDRYTIRVSYDGTRYNPKNLDYDMVVTKNPTVSEVY
ncbi:MULTISPECIES: hypothetical protein [unclassified Moraxella]|uniref:hypothetical protein n=1 Tax=unclassified Moraxella TaxID=2685852 RepID=UPI003AF9E481